MRARGWLAVWICLITGGTVAAPGAEAGGAETAVRCVPSPPKDLRTDLYVSNREPLAPSPLVKLPIGAIRPDGWLRRILELQAAGMNGHLTELSPWCKPEGNAWLAPDGRGHSPWEELPYWLKGFGDLGYVLQDPRIIEEARRWIEAMLASRRPDGWFGPEANRTGSRRVKGKPDFWPNMIALNILQSYYEFTGDRRVLDLMSGYFRFQAAAPEADFLVPFWQKMRGGDNLESIYWLYNRTGERWLLDVAEKVHRRTADWTSGVASWHGVNICQGFREPAIYWMQARKARFLQAAQRNYDTVIGQYGQVPGGMFGADENARPGCDDPRQAAETCSMVEFMHSFEMLTKITGDPAWADRCEEVALNDYPAALTPDLRGLHYLTAPNQVVLDANNHSPGVQNRGCMFAYDPHRYRCCQHNHGHGWPYLAEELWLATSDRGLCASLYAASRVTAKVAEGVTVTIVEDTDYPFEEEIRLRVAPATPVRFPLYLRVPGWCDEPEASVNGQRLPVAARPQNYLVIERTWRAGDTVALRLPMRLHVEVWAAHGGAVSVRRGPLWFSLEIGEQWRRFGGTDDWPAFDVSPTTPWNYGLEVDPASPERSIAVASAGRPAGQPFTPDSAPIRVKAQARRIPEWRVDQHGLAAELQASPAFTDQPLEQVTLIPMGCARLRISAFPRASTDPSANRWEPPPQPDGQVRASHCFERDSVRAAVDGLIPKHSNDHRIPRLTFWPHRGTAEWVEIQFAEPRTVSVCEVYWFDDTGRGLCRTPQAWRLLYREGGRWKPVALAPGAVFGVDRDRWNRAAFEPVETDAMRLEVRLQDGFSAGILECRFDSASDQDPRG